jgi:hypothetical protein
LHRKFARNTLVILLLASLLIVIGWSIFAHKSAAPPRVIANTPYLVTESLDDQAKLANIQTAPILAYAAMQPNYSRFSVLSSQRCSDTFALINHAALGLPQGVIATAMKAYHHARERGLDKRGLLTVVDFNKPSDERRLWVFDLNTNKLLFDTYVSHGAHSGALYAKYFSNRINSYESSIGVILTGKPYEGIEGYSMRLHGLEKHFNSNVFKREVVLHPAAYVNRDFIRLHHEAGKSFGCLAVGRKVATRLINTIKNGTIVVDYYPSHKWLYHSKYLQ